MTVSNWLAADIGGTKTATAVVASTGEVLAASKAATALGGPADLIAQVVTLLEADLARAGLGLDSVVGLGVSLPAVIDEPHGIVRWAPNLPGWRDVPLRAALEQRLGLPVRLEYDGHAAVLGEWWLGAGRGFRDVVFVIAGTGIGGGLVLNGQLYRGASGLAGATGWLVLATQPPAEEPARRLGHWESLAAGPGIVRLAQTKLRHSPAASSLSSVADLTVPAIFDAARQGDALALAVVGEVAQVLGLGIANLVSALNPQVVILGGGVGLQADLLLEPIRAVVAGAAQPISARAAQIVPAALGERAGLLGAARAAWLAFAAPQPVADGP